MANVFLPISGIIFPQMVYFWFKWAERAYFREGMPEKLGLGSTLSSGELPVVFR